MSVLWVLCGRSRGKLIETLLPHLDMSEFSTFLRNGIRRAWTPPLDFPEAPGAPLGKKPVPLTKGFLKVIHKTNDLRNRLNLLDIIYYCFVRCLAIRVLFSAIKIEYVPSS